MILQEHELIAAPVSVVNRQLLAYLRAEGLHAAASAAVEEGEDVLVRAGIGGLTKELAVRALPAYLRGRTTVIPIRWEATGPLGDLFPTLDANVEIDPVDDDCTRLTVVGSYEPPLGRLGARLDQLLLHQLARATARSFLLRLHRVVVLPAPDLDPAASDLDRVLPNT